MRRENCLEMLHSLQQRIGVRARWGLVFAAKPTSQGVQLTFPVGGANCKLFFFSNLVRIADQMKGGGIRNAGNDAKVECCLGSHLHN